MQQHEWKVTFRSLWRKRTLSLLNIGGLAVGIAAATAIFIVVTNELSFDAYHTKGKRIYRMLTQYNQKDGTLVTHASIPLPEPDALRAEFPEFEAVAHIYQVNDIPFIVSDEKRFKMGQEDNVFFAGPEFFRMFDVRWLAGRPETALKEPRTMAISQSTAKKWFGRWQDAMGKTVITGQSHRPFKITGIVEDPPANTDVPMNVILSYEDWHSRNLAELTDGRNWGGITSSSSVFVLLRQGTDTAAVSSRLKDFSTRHFAAANGNNGNMHANWQPLSAVHFDEKDGNYGPGGLTTSDLWALAVIGLFLIGVACINFVNLSTAYAVNRSREVGVRKVLGSSRAQLLRQFFLETAVLVGIALVLACIVLELCLPSLRAMVGKPGLSFNWWKHPSIGVFMTVIAIAVIFLSGAYPALVLSGFDPIEAIKNKITTGRIGGISLRRGLVVVQFVAAQLLIIGTLVVVRQMKFMRDQPLGFKPDQIAMVGIPGTDSARAKYGVLKNEVLRIPGVREAAFCDGPPSEDGGWFTSIRLQGETEARDWSLGMRFGDNDYLSTFGMRLLAGRYPDNSDTLRELTLNETATRLLGFHKPSDAVGNQIFFGNGNGPGHLIVGVVREFHDRPLKDSIDAVMVAPLAFRYEQVAIHLDAAHTGETLDRIRKVYQSVYPNEVFSYSFFDTDIEGYYKPSQVAAHLFQLFSLLAIFISCLGLYGLVSFMATQRTKEVGIRKVLGASVQSIVLLFSREFTLLIGIAFVVAAPLGYYFMNGWLHKFYFRAPIGWMVFALSILLSIIIAWATVGYRALRAALADPVKALKYE
ncbi:MAG TPA: ABC transporter permease [Dinghuibacter sp.]|uniref:ABC transporter permease n=1 Tax=Dinghuibacter sp. TaxID=2024697 RepID=UPI002BC6E20E|nr:ABC transporter permease [Dinghuibacter sp.]HTJ14289.1 ABC transporter permease [Dinghuibacter sp.]